MMEKILQPTLQNENVLLRPLKKTDFETLFAVASDPKIWEQHPNRDRYRQDIFSNFFEGALESGGAFIIIDKKTGETAGSSRYYNEDKDENSIFIGYTFYARKFWGTQLNTQVKQLMLDYIFHYVDLVKFHVGEANFRSRRAVEKLGATLHGHVTVAYRGEPDRDNVEYWMRKEDWARIQNP